MTKFASGRAASVETVRQARSFDAYKRRYVRLGLCYPCAAQAAYGHQLGFSLSKPPCHACQAVVDTFPVKRVNGWSSWSPRHGAKLSAGLRPRKAI
ncbi:hypothetical protein [Paenarthrobacter sp. Y-19]|uniref:hypothetical protein n=1 Tax=Paenarthrobacter sp. Y-19 TaxID=3031125 RepID=UPI0023DC9349|nr:hypothetical protein [Paenarthrobacter sp. Y-19]